MTMLLFLALANPCLAMTEHYIEREERENLVTFNMKFQNRCSYRARGWLKIYAFGPDNRPWGNYLERINPLEPGEERWQCTGSTGNREDCKFHRYATPFGSDRYPDYLYTDQPLRVRWNYTTCDMNPPCHYPDDPLAPTGGKHK